MEDKEVLNVTIVGKRTKVFAVCWYSTSVEKKDIIVETASTERKVHIFVTTATRKAISRPNVLFLIQYIQYKL